MLINCPECNKEVSDKCGNCPNCGYPIKVQEILYEYEGQTYNVKDIVKQLKTNTDGRITREIVLLICDFFSVSKSSDIEFIHDDIIRKHCPEMGYRCFNKDGSEQPSPVEQNVPKCPTCGSPDLSKISTVKKAAKIGMFGIFGAGDIGKTWKCNNCGSRF